MHFYWLLLALLGVWRITHLLHAEDGPWKLLRRFRESLRNTLVGDAFDCFYCLSIWIAAPFAWLVGESWKERALLWPAISGAAILLERMTDRAEYVPPAMWTEDEEKEMSDVLRQK